MIYSVHVRTRKFRNLAKTKRYVVPAPRANSKTQGGTRIDSDSICHRHHSVFRVFKRSEYIPNSRVSRLSRLSSHEREVVGEELSGHSVHEAWKVPRLGCLGGEHLRAFTDGGFHGAPDPHQTGDGTGTRSSGMFLRSGVWRSIS